MEELQESLATSRAVGTSLSPPFRLRETHPLPSLGFSAERRVLKTGGRNRGIPLPPG